MKPNILFLLFTISLTTSLLGQVDKVNHPLLQTNKSEYLQGDTIILNYNLDNLEILNSNFGGCGLDPSGVSPIFFVICHSDSNLTMMFQQSCDILVEEYSYSNKGSVNIVIHNPGIYSIRFFVKNKNQEIGKYEERFRETIESEKFKVLTKQRQ